MKAPYWFALALVLSLGLLFLLEYNLPKKFVWRLTLAHNDHQPFGCAIFDDVLSASSTHYSVSGQTFYQLATPIRNDSIEAPHPAILAIAQKMTLGKADRNALLELAARGSKIMLVASTFNEELCKELHFEHSYAWFQLSKMKEYAASLQPRDSLFWVATPTPETPNDTFICYPQFCHVHFIPKDSLFEPLVTVRVDSAEMINNSLPHCYPAVAMRRSVGKGEIILVSTPMLFTNYGMLDGRNSAYLFRLLAQLGTSSIIRTEAYSVNIQQSQSPLRYLLSQPSLRWAIYVTTGVLLVFMCFQARRRQRAIPVIRPPQNRTLEFVTLIGTLYYQQKQPLDLLRKKFIYFAETLRRNLQVDVDDLTNDALLAQRIARKTGIKEAEIRSLLSELRPLMDDKQASVSISDQQLKGWIDRMNKIQKTINTP